MSESPPRPPADDRQRQNAKRLPWTPPKLEGGADVLDDVKTSKVGVIETGTPVPSTTPTS